MPSFAVPTALPRRRWRPSPCGIPMTLSCGGCASERPDTGGRRRRSSGKSSGWRRPARRRCVAKTRQTAQPPSGDGPPAMAGGPGDLRAAARAHGCGPWPAGTPDVALVANASAGLELVLHEPDSPWRSAWPAARAAAQGRSIIEARCRGCAPSTQSRSCLAPAGALGVRTDRDGRVSEAAGPSVRPPASPASWHNLPMCAT